MLILKNHLQYYLIFFFLFFSINAKVLSQDISSDFYPSEYLQILHDYDIGWQTNSSFKPYQWDDLNELKQIDISQFPIQWMLDDLNLLGIRNINKSGEETDKLQCNAWLGTLLQYSDGARANFQDGSTTLYGYFHFSYKNQFRAWLYPRITTNQYSLPHYTGKPRPNRRAGFNTGETDMAGIGYFGDWIQAWFGRGRQNWGAMALDNLALSEKSTSYDHGTLQLNFHNFRLRYFHGYLEALANNNHRYITGRGIEYNNQRNLIIGAHEIVIYSGVDRPFDLAYLNPIATHLEVELNQRVNRPGNLIGQNAIWQLALDWMPVKRLRLSGNFLADEIVIDDFQRKEGKPHAIAYQARLSWSGMAKNFIYTAFVQYTQVGTYTFRHSDGENNFVSRGLPLGTDLGSDSDRWLSGVRIVTPWRLITTISIGKKRSGEQSILQNLYEPYSQFVEVPFPSGVVDKVRFFQFELSYRPKRNHHFYIYSQIADSNQNENQNFIVLSFDAYFSKHLFY